MTTNSASVTVLLDLLEELNKLSREWSGEGHEFLAVCSYCEFGHFHRALTGRDRHSFWRYFAQTLERYDVDVEMIHAGIVERLQGKRDQCCGYHSIDILRDIARGLDAQRK